MRKKKEKKRKEKEKRCIQDWNNNDNLLNNCE